MFLRNRLSKRNSRGQSLVETALILPIIVLLLLLGIDLGRVFFTSIDLRNAAHEATMLGGTEPDVACAGHEGTVDRQMGRTGQPNAAVCGAARDDDRRRLHHDATAASGSIPVRRAAPGTRTTPPTPTSAIGSSSSTASSRSSRSSAS